MKKVAVITDAMSPGFFFPAWHRYYAGLFGAQALHVVTYQGLKADFAGIELGNLWGVDAAYDDTLRAGVIADLVSALLRHHDVVIRCDVDEFLHPDPARFRDLADFIERNDQPYVTAHGIDVIELEEDAPLDLDQPIFGGQRQYGIRATALNKTCVTSVPLRWARGFHGASAPPRFAGLYLLHLKLADVQRRIAWDGLVLQGLAPGSKEHKYFSAGAAHLMAAQNFAASRPRTGDETQEAFDARFLATVGDQAAPGFHQGAFFLQDFLIPLDMFAPKTARPVSEMLRAYDGAGMASPAGEVLEAARDISWQPPVVLAGAAPGFAVQGPLHIHGSMLVTRRDALLFGPDMLAVRDGTWSCAARSNSAAFCDVYTSPAYAAQYPGARPQILPGAAGMVLDVSMLAPEDVPVFDEPVFLATPSSPAAWNVWAGAMPGKVAQFRRHGAGRKFLCHTAFAWQRAFLQLLGVPDEAVLAHDPGRAFICRDVMCVEYSEVNMTVSAAERAEIFELVATRRARGAYPAKLFMAGTPPDPALQNAMDGLGFTTITPGTLDIAVQIGMFAAAEQIVLHGTAAVGNSVFCPPGGRVVTIDCNESDARLLASLGLRHGMFCGGGVVDPTALKTFFNS